MHGEQIAGHGGSPGIRDAGLLSSAPARPQNQAVYGDSSVFDLAAAYAFGIIRNHPFVDGNKRTGFLAAYVFLNLNGWELMASEAETVAAVLALAANEMEEADFAGWLKSRSVIQETRE
ncbi:MAG: type II toxin-antitoxin system death-on-curing family toxin [Syntrophobacteraceae bacterium]|nr:type II toxin-antitoxin system death-on-curing family toxin [Syntrophobacteraceae bacterium]